MPDTVLAILCAQAILILIITFLESFFFSPAQWKSQKGMDFCPFVYLCILGV